MFRLWIVAACAVSLASGCQSGVLALRDDSRPSEPGALPSGVQSEATQLAADMRRLPPVVGDAVLLASHLETASANTELLLVPGIDVAPSEATEADGGTRSSSRPTSDADTQPMAEVVPSPVSDPAGRAYSLPDMEGMALANNPGLARAAARVRALQGKWVQVGLAPNPTAGYRSDDIGADGRAGKQGMYVGQEFVTAGKLGLNRAVVAQEVQRAEQQLASEQFRVVNDVRLGYYDVLIAQRKVELVHRLAQVSANAATASQDLFRADEIPKIAVLQTEIAAENAKILERRATNEESAAWRRLESVVGMSDMPRVRLSGSLQHAATDLNWSEQLARVLSESPEIAAAVADLDRARWALDRAVVEAHPNITVQTGVQYDSAIEDTTAAVQVGLPLPLWNRNQGGIQQAEQQVVAAGRNITRVELDLRRRLATAFQEYASARFQVDNFVGAILPKAQETLDLVARGYQQGEVGYLDMLTAQRTYFQTNLAYIDSLRELWRASLTIEGLLLTDSLQDRP
jgi:cobalt-zinc-cadmium efflux system outer membrane protein